MSKDSGHTWGTPRNVSLGEVGKYLTRASLRRLGRGRDNAIRLSISDPVRAYLVGAKLTYSKGANQ